MEEINISELFDCIKEKVWIIIAALIISILTSIIYVKAIKKPIYKSSTTYILVSETEITGAEVTLNEKLIATYKEIIKSRTLIERVINNLNLTNVSPSSISSNIKVEQVSTSSMIRITVTNKDPLLAQQIAENIGEEFRKEIEDRYKMNNLGRLDAPLIETTPANASNSKEIILINGAALFISLMIIFVIYYFDTAVKSSEQVEEKINLAVIGSIPLIKEKEDK